MHRLRAGRLSFRRIHLAALIADWRRTLLSVIGVAMGVTVVLGDLILKSELTRPFDAFGPSLTHAADSRGGRGDPERKRPAAYRDGQPSARRSGRGAGSHPDRRRLDARGLRRTPSEPLRPPAHGFFLLGGSCQIELLVGSFNCAQRARDEKPAADPVCHWRFRRSSPSDTAFSSARSCASPGCLRVRRTWAGRSRSSTASKGSTVATCCWRRRSTSLRACSPRRVTSPAHSSFRDRASTSWPISTGSSPASPRRVRPGRTSLPSSRMAQRAST